MATSLKTLDIEPGRVVPGGYFISDEQLARLGDGDVKRGRRELRMMLADAREPKIFRGPTEKPANVRIIKRGDEMAIFRLLRMELFEVAEGIAPPSEHKIAAWIERGIQGVEGVVIGVIDAPGVGPVATIGLTQNQWWFTNNWHVAEMWNYVHPDHRKSTYAHDLIQFSKWANDEWTANLGYQTYLVTGVLTTKKVQQKVRLYRRMLTQAGAWFLYPWPSRET